MTFQLMSVVTVGCTVSILAGLNLGVYHEEERGFVGVRHKMGQRYLFT